jgi:hypothetical protein
MASSNEKTFGSKIANADTLATHLTTFTTYAPVRPEESVVNYKGLITTIKTNNTLVASTKTTYSQAVDKRVKLFTKNTDSLNKTLAPIAGQIKAKFGKTSKEAEYIGSLITKIRGESSKKLKKDDEGEFVSQSERSYGSMTQTFNDIITTLTTYGTDYAPANVKIKLPALTTQLTALSTANTGVTTAYGQYKPAKDNRLTQYADLKDRSSRIKDSVKSQFGLTSNEYKLIKGLSI